MLKSECNSPTVLPIEFGEGAVNLPTAIVPLQSFVKILFCLF
jgi:hypothetical protein